MKAKLLVTIALTGVLGLGVLQARVWTSADGSKTFVGDFKSWDEEAGTVTVQMSTGRVITFDVSKLSEDDLAFLKEQKPGEAVAAAEEANEDFAKSELGKALRKMEKLDGRSFKKHEFATVPEFYILYYSASW